MRKDEPLPDFFPDAEFIEFLKTRPVNGAVEGYARLVIRAIELRLPSGKEFYEASMREFADQFAQYKREKATFPGRTAKH